MSAGGSRIQTRMAIPQYQASVARKYPFGMLRSGSERLAPKVALDVLSLRDNALSRSE